MKRLLSVEEAAEYTGFTVRFLRRLIFERRVAYHKDRRRVWLSPDDLDAYVRNLRVEARGDGQPPWSIHVAGTRRSR